jgi:hypothetical protein
VTVNDTESGPHSESVLLQGDDTHASFTVVTDGAGGADVFDPPAAPATTTAAIAAGGSLTISAASNETVNFTGSTGALVLDQPGNFTGHISGFTGTAPDAAHSDTIDLAGINYDSAHFAETYNASTGVLSVTDGTDSAQLNFDNFNATLDFASDGKGGTLITDPPATASSGASTEAASGGVLTVMDGSNATASAHILLSSLLNTLTADQGNATTIDTPIAFGGDHTVGPTPAAVSPLASASFGSNGNDSFAFHPTLGEATLHGSSPAPVEIGYANTAAAAPPPAAPDFHAEFDATHVAMEAIPTAMDQFHQAVGSVTLVH